MINDMLQRVFTYERSRIVGGGKAYQGGLRQKANQEDKNKLFEFVRPILSEEEMEQLKNLLQSFE